MINVKRTTDATQSPVSLELVKNYLRIADNADDQLLEVLIKASVQRLQDYAKASFINATYTLTMDRFYGDVIYLPYAPSSSVTSVTTYNAANTGTVFSSDGYRLTTQRDAITLNDAYTWPTVERDHEGVQIIYVAGHGASEGEVPEAIKMGILLDVSAMYHNRGVGCEIPLMAKESIAPYKNWDNLGSVLGDVSYRYISYGV